MKKIKEFFGTTKCAVGAWLIYRWTERKGMDIDEIEEDDFMDLARLIYEEMDIRLLIGFYMCNRSGEIDDLMDIVEKCCMSVNQK